jgi:hypothetical protein
MASVNVKINVPGMTSFLESAPMQAMIQEHGERCQQAANATSSSASYNLKMYTKGRATALIGTDGIVAARSNAKHGTLIKALGSA